MVSVTRGPKGEPGTQGERGARGLSWLQGKAVVVLFVFCAAGIVGNLFWSAHLSDRGQQQAEHQAAETQQLAVKQNRQTQQALCTLLDAALATRVGRPADPKRTPVQEATWEWQQRYLTVSHTFRC